jgi:hypothetical protein
MHYCICRHRALCRCATRCNFLSSADDLATIFHEPFQGINYDRFLKHVETCPDPMCGRVFNVDGTCKVFREICGAPLPIPAEYNAAESDVQNVVHRGFLRQKRCDNMPHRVRRDGHVFCDDCHRRLQTQGCVNKDDLTALEPVAKPSAALGPMTRTTRQTSLLSEREIIDDADHAVDDTDNPADVGVDKDILYEEDEYTTDMVCPQQTFYPHCIVWGIQLLQRCSDLYSNFHQQVADRLHISWDVFGVQDQCEKDAATR